MGTAQNAMSYIEHIVEATPHETITLSLRLKGNSTSDLRIVNSVKLRVILTSDMLFPQISKTV